MAQSASAAADPLERHSRFVFPADQQRSRCSPRGLSFAALFQLRPNNSFDSAPSRRSFDCRVYAIAAAHIRTHRAVPLQRDAKQTESTARLRLMFAKLTCVRRGRLFACETHDRSSHSHAKSGTERSLPPRRSPGRTLRPITKQHQFAYRLNANAFGAALSPVRSEHYDN